MHALTTAVISWDRMAYASRMASAHGCGAAVTFVGAVRADQDGHRAIRALCYEAYVEMAEPMIQGLISEASARWALGGVQVRHRLGVVKVGEISLRIVVVARHRMQAYAASRFLIERIKHDVPIWKREQYDDGRSQWMPGVPEVLGAAEPSGVEHAGV